MKKAFNIIALLAILGFGVSCSKKIAPGTSFSTGLGANPFGGDPGTTDDPTGGTEEVPEEEPTNMPPGGYGKGQGCDGMPLSTCQGGFGNDAEPKDIMVKVILSSEPGTSLTNDPQGFSNTFITNMSRYYSFNGHKYMGLKLDEVIEDDGGLTDGQLIQKYANGNGVGQLIMILVDNIPGGTAGYVQNSCARMEQGQAWTVFEFGLVNAGVVEHETNHIFCFPHTSSQNGGTPVFFLSGYNPMEDVLRQRNSYKADKPINPAFNIYVDAQNRANAQVTFDGMVFDTHNLMYYSVLQDRPALFTPGSTGYHYSYSHLIDYYYWNFVKPGGKPNPPVN